MKRPADTLAVVDGVSPSEFAYLKTRGYASGASGIVYDGERGILYITRRIGGLHLSAEGPLDPQVYITDTDIRVISTGPIDEDISRFVEAVLKEAAGDITKSIRDILREYRVGK